MSPVDPAERGRRGAAARAVKVASTRPTGRPGSETTDLRAGDRVRVRRAMPRSDTGSRYDGREGTVVALNRQRFPGGRRYVEIGVAWSPTSDLARAATDAWFRADELVAVTRSLFGA